MKTRNLILASLAAFLGYQLLYKKDGINIDYQVNNLVKHPTKTFGKRSLNAIDKIIVHHFASDGTAYAISNYHVNSNDWPGIGYHFVIQKNGQIVQTNDFDTVSYHVAGQNTGSIGIALEGNFQDNSPTNIQLANLKKLVQYINAKFPQNLTLHQHSDFNPGKPYDASLNLSTFTYQPINSINSIYNEYKEGYYECKDGKFTDSNNKGYCSHHGGQASELDTISDSDVEAFFYKDYFIAEYLMNTKIRVEDFYRYGGRKSDVKYKLHWLSKNATPLDTDAQELSNNIGVEVSPEDIIDIVLSYSSAKDFMNDLKYQTLENLKRQYNV